MPLRGVVFGWYHQRNAGDDRFAHCIERWLHDHELTFLPHTQPPPLDVLRSADYVLLGGGSLANEHAGLFAGMKRWVAAAGLPVFGVGLTVGLHPELRDEFRAVIESGGSLWLRDRQSAEWLGLDRGVTVGPDIAWLFPRTFPRRPEPNTLAVNFRPWPKRTWQPADWREAFARTGRRLVPWALCEGKDADRPTLEAITGRPLPDKEFDPRVPAEVEAVVAMRFHAVVFALQTGTPVVPVANSKKLAWMLDDLGLGKLAVPVEDPSGLPAALDRALAVCTPDRLTDLSSRLHREAWAVADRLKADIETAARGRVRRASFPQRLKAKITRLLGGW